MPARWPRASSPAGFDIRSQIIWAKDRLVLSRGHYHWQHEPCWYAVRKNGTSHWSGDRKQTTLWQIPSRDQDAATVHGTQKPVELHAPADAEQLRARAAGLRPVPRIGDQRDRRRDLRGASASGSSSTRPMST